MEMKSAFPKEDGVRCSLASRREKHDNGFSSPGGGLVFRVRLGDAAAPATTAREHPMSTTVTTHASYGKRLGDSLKGILFGLVVFIAGFPLLFWNEGRNVIRANALKEAEAAMVEAEYDNVDSSLEGKVVHVSGMATTDEILQDGLLPIAANAISLIREVQMYQWLEESKSETKKKVGGSTDTVTTYSYTKDWVSHPVDSSRFQEAGHQNPPEFPLQDETIYASLVSFGARRLSESQVACIGGASALHASSALSSSNAEAVENAVGQAVAFARSGLIADIEANVELMRVGAAAEE